MKIAPSSRFNFLAALLFAACGTKSAGGNGGHQNGGGPSAGSGGAAIAPSGGGGTATAIGGAAGGTSAGAGGAASPSGVDAATETGTPGTGGTGRGGGGAGPPLDGSGPSGAQYFVSPNGTGTACSSAEPCSITQVQMVSRGVASGMQSDVVVELADGTYPLKAPLVFTAADSGSNGHLMVWQARAGAHPVISGAQRITGWTVSDAGKNIWKAPAASMFATRQLFIDGRLATRARLSVNRSDLTFSTTGFGFSTTSLASLNTIAHPERAELHAIGSFTDRYSPVATIANNNVTMVQPAWANNSWGYDTIPTSFRPGPVYMENAYEFIDQPGEWYQDTSAGLLYYKPLANQDMANADVELPQLEVLISFAGTYDQPAHDFTFRGLTFSFASWLGPNTSDGYASQQTGAFISGSGYAEFEATRSKWHQMPAAVQVSAAKNVSFVRDRFVAIGQAGLGIGNDDNAHLSKLGLGTDTINVTGCVFTQIAAGAIVIGGIQENAHHPSDPRMLNQNMTISDNLIHDVAIDYRDGAGILFTYTKNVIVSHNEVYNLPYSGINSGYGWGANDAGGSDDYANRGLYKYQPRYTTATTAQNNQVVANFVHDGMQQMNDGGCHYNLSANPGTMVTGNYCKGPWPSSNFADYEDEGSRYLTISKNVFASFGSWGTANANASNNTGDLTVTGNWISGGQSFRGNNNTITGNITINGALPTDAQAVVAAAGLESSYADLKTNP